MDRIDAPAHRRKPPGNGYSPTLPPPRHVSTLPDLAWVGSYQVSCKWTAINRLWVCG